MIRLLARALGDLKDAVLITEGQRNAAGVRPIIFVNTAFTEMTGFSYEEAVGRLPDLTIGPETDRAALETIQAARERLEPVRVELLKYKKDGSTFWSELDIVPVLDADGQCSHFIGVMRDVTDRRRAQARLVEAERLAAVGALAAGVAHEINNPLAYIIANVQFVDAEIEALAGFEALGDEAAGRLRELRRVMSETKHGAMRIAQIVRDIRTFARSDDEPAREVDVAALIEQSIQVARTGVPAAPRVTWTHVPLPPVHGNGARLAQALVNVLVNALQAVAGRGEANAVEVRAVATDREVIVEVCDEGVGISADILPRIFDPFFTTKPGGQGLGLSLAHGVVTKMGGRVTVESTRGVGTVVRIALPRGEAAAGHDAVAAPSSRMSHRLAILVVDDDDFVGAALLRLLKRDHDVRHITSGEAALALFASGERAFDLVLCDLTMPGMGGEALYKRVRDAWPDLAARFAIMTGGASTEAGHRFVKAVSVPVLDKPIERAGLDRVLAWAAERTARTT